MTEEQLPSNADGNVRDNRPLDLNRASLKELTTLAGVGEVLAGRIIAARPFQSIDDLSRVQGINPALISQIRSQITIAETEGEIPDEQGPVFPVTEGLPVDRAVDAVSVETMAHETETEDLPAEAYPTDMFPGEEISSAALKDAPEPKNEPGSTGITAAEMAAASTSSPSAAPAQPSRRTITPSEALWITAGSSLLAILVSVLVTLGVLAAINGGLNFVRPADLVVIERRINGLSSNTEIIENEVNSLRSRLSNLEGLSGRVSSVEQTNEALQEDVAAAQENLDALDSQIGALSTGIEEVQGELETIQQDMGRFNTFLSGLAELLGDVTGPAAEPEAEPGGK